MSVQLIEEHRLCTVFGRPDAAKAKQLIVVAAGEPSAKKQVSDHMRIAIHADKQHRQDYEYENRSTPHAGRAAPIR